MNNFQLMAGFNAWVNRRLYASVAVLSDADYRLDRKAFFGSIHRTLNHLLVVDRLWTGRIRGEDQHGMTLDMILYDEFAALRSARVEEDARIVALVNGMGEAQLQAPLRYRRVIGTGEQQTRTDHVLLTLFNHQTHHRGQVHGMLSEAGQQSPPWDLIFYLEELNMS